MTDIRKVEVSGPHILGDGRYAVRATVEGVSDEVLVFDDPVEAVLEMGKLETLIAEFFTRS